MESIKINRILPTENRGLILSNEFDLKNEICYEDFAKICRICLSKKDIYPIEAVLLEFYLNLADSKENENKMYLPQSICKDCLRKMQEISMFISTSKENEIYLTSIYINRIVLKYESSESERDNSIEDVEPKPAIKAPIKLERSPRKSLKKVRKKNLQCQVCNKLFYGKLAFTNHNKVHKYKELKQYLCNYCGKNFKKKSHLDRHIRTHTGIKPYICTECDKGFGQSNDLKRHLLIHTREKVFKCDHCTKAFHQKSCLDNHKMTHNNTKNFHCNFCEKKFAMKSYLEIHMRTHTGIKPFQCSQCDKCFYQKSGLKNHILTHTGEKPFKCTYCEKTFVQSNHLKEHSRIHSGEKPYICSYCGKAFAYSSTLKVHLRQHTGETPFICTFCNKGFHDTSNLRRHVVRHHNHLELKK